MIVRNGSRALMAGFAAGVLSLAATHARAGGLAVHEHSASAQGASYAGVAAGGQLSSMFWNPSVMTQFGGISLEASASAVIGTAKNTVTGGTLAPFFPYMPSDFLDDSVVPAIYASWQVRPDLWLGLSVNAPFGLSVSFPTLWPGRNYAQDTTLKTYNATPSIAYRVNDWLSVGVGLQIEYATASFSSGLTLEPLASLLLEGNGWGIGATAGVTIKPGPNTVIGIGWRSAINQKISGTIALPVLPFTSPSGPVHTTLRLPDIVSLGIRQRIDPKVTLLGTVEWTNWSQIGTSTVYLPSGASAVVLGKNLTLPFQYRDGWLFSSGVEYAWRPDTTLRAGLGYEISPIDTAVRTPRLPDANRTWVSVGLTHAFTSKLKVDFAYSHVFIDKAKIAIGPGTGNPWYNGAVSYFGTASGAIDIISIGLKYQFGTPQPPQSRNG